MRSKTKPGSHSRLSADVRNQKSMQQDSFSLESERDSGFSDTGSEYLTIMDQADSTEQELGSRPQTSEKTLVGAAYSGYSSMILMNNVLFKPPSGDSSPVKSSFHPAVEMVQHPQMVFLQPVASKADSKSTVQRGKVLKQRLHNKYLPILKSYPRIAPHPGRIFPSSSEYSISVPSHQSPHQRMMQQYCKSSVSTADLPSPLLVSPSECSTQTSSLEQPVDSMEVTVPISSFDASSGSCAEPSALSTCSYSSLQGDVCPNSPSECHSKRKRFCNTYNILSMSGLLDITLRTKELIRQNRRTQSDLEQLRRQTSLLVEAAGSSNPQVWAQLQLTVLEPSPNGFLEKEEVIYNSVA
ncbi:CLOCK-interacting pacemaker-like [Arapaima gigas]